MKKLLWIIIILSIFTNANIAQAQSALPATSVRTSDGSNVQLKLNALSSSAASNTAEIEAINQNLATHEAELAAVTAEINLMNVNLGTIETRIDSIESNILSMIEPAITELRLNLGTIEDLINSNYNSLFANLGTHENELNDIKSNLATHETSLLALQTNDGTQETRIESTEVGLARHENNVSNPHSVTATQVPYTDTYLMGVTTVQSALDTIELWLSSINVTNDSQDVQIENNHVAITLKADSDEIHTDISQAYVNVKEFGAVGDGIVDDAAAINNAIASLTSGGVVLFPAGYYCIKSQITLTRKHGLILRGVGHGKNTTYLGTNIYATGFNGHHFRGVDCVGISIENMSLTAEGQDSAFGVGGIYFSLSGSSNNPYHSFKDLFISDISNGGIAISTPIMNNFKNVTVRKCVGSAFNLWGGTSTSWLNCYANNATESGFLLTRMTYCTLQGCAAEGAGVGYYFDNSKSISVMGCGTEAIVDRGGAFNGYAYRSINGSNAVTLYDCYDRISETGTFSESAGGLLDYINHKTDSNAQITKLHSLPASSSVYTDTYNIGATNLQTVLDTVAVWLNSVDLRLESLETNIISLIQPAIDIITANLDTHETSITALITNDQTQEVRLVRATASYENRYKKMILQYGYPIAINGLWDVNKAAAVYAMYDIVVIGDEYEKTAHEAHADTVSIIEKLKELKTDVEVFGYVAIGGELGANLDTAEIQLRIDEWLATGATGIFLDEFGYDYLVTRERQNMAIDYAHNKGMNIIANSWNIDWVFNNDDGYIEWEEFYGNPNLVAPSISSNDYYLFENLFYYYEGGQKASDQWRIYEVYRYYYDSATSTWGKNYYDQFGTKTLGLDGIQSTNANKDLYFINAYVGGRIINLDGYGASIELWGSSSTAYNHYNPSFFNNEASMFHRDKIQPTVSNYTGTTYAQYDTKINGVTAKLIWKPGATASNPTLGTHKVQINGVDRTKTYVSSSATNTNTASTLVARDASGNFSAGTITAALAGNASTATKLAIPKNIAGTAFDGSLDIDISHNNLINIGLRSHDDIDAAFSTIEIELSSISVAINNLDLRLGAIELILAGGSSGEVLTKTDDSFTWATIPAGATAIEDIGTYIESNTTWEFDTDYDTTAVLIYRNRLYQPRSLFITVDVSGKTRVVFSSAINASDEVILISNK